MKTQKIQRDPKGRWTGSGNPRGRPRKVVPPLVYDLGLTLRELVASTTVPMKFQGQAQDLPMLQALAIALVQQALSSKGAQAVRSITLIQQLLRQSDHAGLQVGPFSWSEEQEILLQAVGAYAPEETGGGAED